MIGNTNISLLLESMSNVVMDATPNLILIVDKEMRICECNKMAQKFLGVSREDALNQIYPNGVTPSSASISSISLSRVTFARIDAAAIEMLLLSPFTTHSWS